MKAGRGIYVIHLFEKKRKKNTAGEKKPTILREAGEESN